MAALDFGAQVEQWVGDVKGAEEAVFKQATQEIIEEMQRPVGAGGNMPVDTGFMRSSLMASTSAMPLMTRENPGAGAFAYDQSDITLAIAGAELGETIYAGYTANYAGHQEFGSNGRQGRGFVRLAAQRWPSIVEQVTAQLRQRLGL